MPILMFAFFSFWWPQIVLCARSDSRQPLRPEFVLGTSAARLALPLYVYGCPSNLLRVAPNPPLCAALVAWVGLQAGLLLAQHWLGPRCFVPRVVSAGRGACLRWRSGARQCSLRGTELAWHAGVASKAACTGKRLPTSCSPA